jgi:hypothetical protein
VTLPLLAGPAGGGLALSDLTRDGARDAVQEELRKQEYVEAQPSLVTRALDWLFDALSDVLDGAAAVAPGGTLGVIALLVLLGLFVAVVLLRIGPLGRTSAPPPLFEGGRALSAADHRRLAEAAAGEGRFAEAVRERLRAVVRDLEARGALDPRPGRTAGEVARDAGAVVPALAADLSRATSLFDEVWYGGRPADASSYAVLVAVDDEVGASRLTVS